MMLEIKEVSKYFGEKQVLNNISLNIDKGDVFGLLGPNGAGKSTLINILSCITKQESGDIFFENQNIKINLNEFRKKIGVVSQDVSLYQELSAYENLIFWGSLYDIPEAELKKRTNEILTLLNLYHRRSDKIKTFSGGMKRKINIACSILHNPPLLLMDEPTVGLDPKSRNEILQLIQELSAQKITIIYTTHYMEIAEKICNKIAIINEGNILAKGSISDLKKISGIKDNATIKLKEINSHLIDTLNSKYKISKVNNESNTIFFECENLHTNIPEILNSIQDCKVEILSIQTSTSDLETIFMQLTGKTLRD